MGDQQSLKRLVLSNFPQEFAIDESILSTFHQNCEQLEYLEANMMMTTQPETRKSVTFMLEKIFDNWGNSADCNLRHVDLREYSNDPDEGRQILGALMCIDKLHTLKISYNHCANNN